MAYTVSITNDGGRVLVVVDGGDSDFSQSFDKGDLGVKVFDGSATLSLFKVANDETVCTFTKDTCIAPVAATTALLMTALNALLGAGPAASLPTGASTAAKQTELIDLLGAFDDTDTLWGDLRELLNSAKSFIGSTVTPAAGSVNAQLAALNILTEAVALALTEPEPAIDDAFSIAAIATESSVWYPRGAKVITVQYATTLTGGGGTNDVKLQGSMGGSVWVDMDADNGIGDQAGVLNYNLYNGTGAAYSAVRIAITRYVNATAVVNGFIYAIR